MKKYNQFLLVLIPVADTTVPGNFRRRSLFDVWVSKTLIQTCSTTILYTTLLVVVFFTLTDRASTIPSNIRAGCQSGTWSAGQKKIRGTSAKLQGEQKKLRRKIIGPHKSHTLIRCHLLTLHSRATSAFLCRTSSLLLLLLNERRTRTFPSREDETVHRLLGEVSHGETLPRGKCFRKLRRSWN